MRAKDALILTPSPKQNDRSLSDDTAELSTKTNCLFITIEKPPIAKSSDLLLVVASIVYLRLLYSSGRMHDEGSFRSRYRFPSRH